MKDIKTYGIIAGGITVAEILFCITGFIKGFVDGIKEYEQRKN